MVQPAPSLETCGPGAAVPPPSGRLWYRPLLVCLLRNIWNTAHQPYPLTYLLFLSEPLFGFSCGWGWGWCGPLKRRVHILQSLSPEGFKFPDQHPKKVSSSAKSSGCKISQCKSLWWNVSLAPTPSPIPAPSPPSLLSTNQRRFGTNNGALRLTQTAAQNHCLRIKWMEHHPHPSHPLPFPLRHIKGGVLAPPTCDIRDKMGPPSISLHRRERLRSRVTVALNAPSSAALYWPSFFTLLKQSMLSWNVTMYCVFFFFYLVCLPVENWKTLLHSYCMSRWLNKLERKSFDQCCKNMNETVIVITHSLRLIISSLTAKEGSVVISVKSIYITVRWQCCRRFSESHVDAGSRTEVETRREIL